MVSHSLQSSIRHRFTLLIVQLWLLTLDFTGLNFFKNKHIYFKKLYFDLLLKKKKNHIFTQRIQNN